jgi:hypothetical protein
MDMPKSEKASIYNFIEMNAIHALALKPVVANIHVPHHVTPAHTSARELIDGHTWGTYGKDGGDSCKEVKLIECETEHLKNILRTQPQITSFTTLVIMAILMERNAIEKVKK